MKAWTGTDQTIAKSAEFSVFNTDDNTRTRITHIWQISFDYYNPG